MQSLIDMLQQQMTPDMLQQLGQRIGADQQTTAGMVSGALPMILGALARNAQDPQGAQDLQSALERDHDGGILGQMKDHLLRGDARQGESILGHIFGDRQNAVEQGLSSMGGLTQDSSGQLLAMLAPIVMGMLGRAQRQENLDAGGLAGMLQNESRQAQERSPQLMGALTQLLDANNDGSVMDDLLRMGQGLLGSFLRGGRA